MQLIFLKFIDLRFKNGDLTIESSKNSQHQFEEYILSNENVANEEIIATTSNLTTNSPDPILIADVSNNMSNKSQIVIKIL